MRYTGWHLWLPDLMCDRCDVAWSSEHSSNCWVCDDPGRVMSDPASDLEAIPGGNPVVVEPAP